MEECENQYEEEAGQAEKVGEMERDEYQQEET